ncbi:MAG TPA: COX15/CtaA family protein [Myxococcaceae bacterium]|jgi:heme A synthase|nr:COX15/CtaA family protein [Myxococcaceae bacterium]
MVPSASFRRATWALLTFTLAVIAWGALVRASHSGDGCGANWPTCNGELFPTGGVLKTRIEFTHRVMSGAVLALTAAWAAWAFRLSPAGSRVRRGAGAAAVLVLGEALIGAGIVLLRLVGTDASVTRTAGMGLHLLNTFLLLAALLLTGLWAGGLATPRLRGQAPVSTLLWASLGALVVLGMTGAVAALGDTLFPSRSLGEGILLDASPTAHFLLRLRILHPALAAFAASLLLATAAVSAVLRPGPAVRRAALAVAALVAAQMLVGLVNLLALAPVGLQLLHLAVADLVWLATVALFATALAEDAPRLAMADSTPAGAQR